MTTELADRLEALEDVASAALALSIIMDRGVWPRETLDTLRKSLVKLAALEAKGTEHAE